MISRSTDIKSALRSRQRGFLLNPYRFSVGGGGDPHYANVSLLLHGDGANASTVFTDSSPTPKTLTAVGNAQISTTQSKFGGASMYFDGTGDYLTIPTTSDLYFPADFTIESWMWKSSSGLQTLFHGLANGSLSVQIGNTTIDIGRSQIAYVIQAAYAPTLNSWFHFALTRAGTTYRVFINGSIVGTVVDANALIDTSFTIAATPTVINAWNGYIDDLRITKGVARYTANFTPPTAAFPNS